MIRAIGKLHSEMFVVLSSVHFHQCGALILDIISLFSARVLTINKKIGWFVGFT